MEGLLDMRSSSRIMTRNNSLTENNVSFAVYGFSEMGTFKLNNVTFTRNNLMNSLLHTALNTSCYNPE